MAECAAKGQVEDCPAARGAAKAAVKEVFAILGVDVEKPEAVEDFRKSLRWGDSMRRASDKGFIAFVLAVVAILTGAFIVGVKVKLGLG